MSDELRYREITDPVDLRLAIVERIARAHGGRFELTPRPGGGLTARLELALAEIA